MERCAGLEKWREERGRESTKVNFIQNVIMKHTSTQTNLRIFFKRKVNRGRA